MSPRAPDLSIIIVNWNTKYVVGRCIESVLNSTLDIVCEIIVVDNGSSDGSQDYIRSTFRTVRLIENTENMGFARANNAALKICRGKFICLINSDIILEDFLFSEMMEDLDSDPGIGILAPKIVYPDGRVQYSCKRFPTLYRYFMDAFRLSSVFKRWALFNGEADMAFRYDKRVAASVLVGAFWLFRAQLVGEVGYLDENFFIYSEDVDFCKRVVEKNYVNVFDPRYVVVHHHAASSGLDPERFYLEQRKSRLFYWKKHHPVFQYNIYRLMYQVNYSLRVAACSVLGVFLKNQEYHMKRKIYQKALRLTLNDQVTRISV